MLSFFPKPYPDEILYSILARYHIRSGNISPKQTLQELFSSRSGIATADLPCNLGALAANLASVSQITVEELIQKHTLYPFYAAFLPQERSQFILESMQSGNGEIHSTAGIRASSVKVPKYFRFCPQCSQVDRERYGELYWHRIHQVPGVLVCPKHFEELQNSSVFTQGFNRHEYLVASDENCIINESSKKFNSKTLETLCLLAQDICFLLNSRILTSNFIEFQQQYLFLLIERGLATATGRVHQRELLSQFLYFYGYQTLEALDSRVNCDDEQNWLSSIVRKHRKAFHPIRHLLMIRFLGLSIEEFFKGDRCYKPFGEPPWLCLNVAAAHYLKPIITNLTISRCCDTKKPVGTFSCSCGFIYCRTGPDEAEEDSRRIGKIKAVGSIWQQQLKQYVEVERLGLRETARRLNVDPNTIKRHVRLLGLTSWWQSSNVGEHLMLRESYPFLSVSVEDTQNYHRKKWKALQQQQPSTSKTALRQLAPATYIWLHRNDREWLDQNSPPASKPVFVNKRVDWHQRDEQILAELKQAVQILLAAEKPVQITISRVAKAIACLALIEQHINKMPLTKTFLDSVVETTEDFQIRRIKWVVEQLDRRGEAIEPWKVVRMAGLKPTYSERVRQAIESEVYGKRRDYR